MRHLPKSHFKSMPWKNGGGETIEILNDPDGAGLDDFQWRISMARVAQDGAFSNFPQIDRHLAVLDGDRMDLIIDGKPACRLTPESQAFSFAGDVLVEAVLGQGPITDLNVMVRRGAWLATVERVDLKAPQTWQGAGDLAVIYVSQGELQCVSKGTEMRIPCGDAIRIEHADGPVSLQPHGHCRIWRVELQAINGR
jgi:environmental stress-induced protein Ves